MTSDSMTRDDLVASARLLAQPSPQAADEYVGRSEGFAEELNRRMAARPDVAFMVGGNLAMMEDNHRNHARFMGALFCAYSPAVLVDKVLWVFRAYRSHGFQLTYWPAQLDTWVDVLRRELSPQAFAEIYPFYRWMIVNQAAFALISDSTLSQGAAAMEHRETHE
jgi:hypothetical protein